MDRLSTLANVSTRQIVHRTRGHRHGPITRLVSPSDLGNLIKPFVFLDYFEAEPQTASGFGWHPHSGIATITFVLSGATSYEDSTGKQGILPAGGIEWMRAGGGVWHTGGAANSTSLMQGFQLWIALPPEQELAAAESVYLPPQEVAADGPVQVILGQYGVAQSAIPAPPSLNYLAVRVKDGDRWRFEPSPEHTVCWVAVQSGGLEVGEPIATGELVVFEESTAAIEFTAKGDTLFILGSAIKHPHPLVLGHYSVHTSPDALEKGETEIRRLAKQLQAAGRLK